LTGEEKIHHGGTEITERSTPVFGDSDYGSLHFDLLFSFASCLRDLRASVVNSFLYSYKRAYRAWQEAVLLDASLARHQRQIERWSRARVAAVFIRLQQLPGARADVDVPVLARMMDRFFWDLLGQALHLPAPELDAILESTTHLLHHALFADSDQGRIHP
jgi:hypothetical protein